ncbi:hypothetical protein CMO93_02355 [Candidatus Woesearchaeota archaeon]|nr:hypothetical protein [Candidatus Woesearchaeota archaeon]|tara:strand:- start:13946 stop:14545 length:600 start_codon:yes stop_codon:yes gene_type:complete
MVKLDEQEVKIIREIIRNPRISDNAIAKKTRVPVMTVNRKRKALEESEIINYYADIKHGEDGIQDFSAEQLYIVQFKIRITKQEVLDKLRGDKTLKRFNAEHVISSYVGEKEGHLALIMIVNAHSQRELPESFNAFIVPMLNKNLGDDCILSVTTTRILEPIRHHHNYIHHVNIEKGRIKDDWPDDFIFVDRGSYYKER